MVGNTTFDGMETIAKGSIDDGPPDLHTELGTPASNIIDGCAGMSTSAIAICTDSG